MRTERGERGRKGGEWRRKGWRWREKGKRRKEMKGRREKRVGGEGGREEGVWKEKEKCVCSGIVFCVRGFVCFLGNRPHPSATEPPFPDSDPRRQFALKSCDPRVHFALVCGAVVSDCDPVFLSCKLPSPMHAAAVARALSTF